MNAVHLTLSNVHKQSERDNKVYFILSYQIPAKNPLSFVTKHQFCTEAAIDIKYFVACFSFEKH